jgi:putative N-acetylmannosamine-6-phosphate epimerase
MSVRQSKPKIIETLNGLIVSLQMAEPEPMNKEWQAVMIAREVVASASVMQLAKAIERVAEQLRNPQLRIK